MFSSVLIANRGEIACRVIRTARRFGMRTIAVHSEADSEELHVRMADEAHLVGPADVAQSYLDGKKMLRVARKTGADCIHPGYGFLSENAVFASECEEAGIKFVGPPADAIRAMGLKDAAKQIMADAGVPIVPGYMGKNQGAKFLEREADKIGYPVLIKAVAGGGGKGMRRVDRAPDFAPALEACRREAKAAFGDERVLIEKFVENPRHIEIQVFADGHGNVVHLFERDCSLQRRHQKVIEEAPAPDMTAEMRDAMGSAAVQAVRAVGYESAGTVEFIVDASRGLRSDGFFFMEMNTRLQVEHPVTEMIAGLDLVEQQFRVAAGEPLEFTQDDLTFEGHAVEARLYAEDPLNGFLPQSGKLRSLRWPDDVEGLRVDAGVEEGATISPFYDPMIAKVIAHGRTRADAISKLVDGLEETQLTGLRTNLPFLLGLLNNQAFREARLDTGFIEARWEEIVPPVLRERAMIAAVLCALDWQRGTGPERSEGPWEMGPGWKMAGLGRGERLRLVIDGTDVLAVIEWGNTTRLSVSGEDGTRTMSVRDMVLADGSLSGVHADEPFSATWEVDVTGERISLVTDDRILVDVSLQDLTAREEGAGAGGRMIRAPMSGQLIRFSARVGDRVQVGEQVAILEAMKMEHALCAGLHGKITEVGAHEGDQVEEGQLLVMLEPVE